MEQSASGSEPVLDHPWQMSRVHVLGCVPIVRRARDAPMLGDTFIPTVGTVLEWSPNAERTQCWLLRDDPRRPVQSDSVLLHYATASHATRGVSLFVLVGVAYSTAL